MSVDTMDIQTALRDITERRDLGRQEMAAVMRQIMGGGATPAQIGGLLIGLRMKGETVDEIVGAATVMRELASAVEVDKMHLVDTCGTGGDAQGTFNISTAAALVAAAAGARVAKHGNRSVSSHSGSADVLEAAGVNLDLSAGQVARCIDELGVGFLFAPLFHGAMRHAIGPRREMKVRTLFNLLGPLTNPAGAPNQVLGVFSEHWVEPLAEVLASLGSRHVLVVNAADGLDEISIGGPSRVAELRDGDIHSYIVGPEDFGLSPADLETLRVGSAEESLRVILGVLDNQPGPARDIVILNAGAAIYAAGVEGSLHEGVARARHALDSGVAARKLRELAELSHALST